MPVIATLDELSIDALKRIISEPKNALLKQYKKLIAYDGVELEIDQDAVKAIAEKAAAKKIGARGLRSIIEEVMTDVMYEVPSKKDIKKVRVTKEDIIKGKIAI